MERVSLTNLKDRLKGAAVIADAYIGTHYKEYLPDDFIGLTAAEGQKSLRTVERICKELLRRGAGKDACVAAVGGGLTGDVAGFVASVYMRGVEWVYVPTTLLALVDSSIGGKTGVNLSGKKNVIGSFCAPKETLFCPEFLNSLPERELDNARAEIVKTAALDRAAFELVKANAPLEQLIGRCRDFKSEVVSSDFLDRGARRQLNFGHTVGHALELRYGLSHGQAVAAGMRAEIFLAGVTHAYLAEFIHNQTAQLIGDLRLSAADALSITKNALSDKKNAGGRIVLCVPVEPGEFKQVSLAKDEFLSKLKQYLGR